MGWDGMGWDGMGWDGMGCFVLFCFVKNALARFVLVPSRVYPSSLVVAFLPLPALYVLHTFLVGCQRKQNKPPLCPAVP